MALSLRFGAVSDIGRVRKKNDDSGYAGPHLIVVADGMGGAPAGDLASAVTIQTMRRLDTQPPDDVLHALASTILIANERLAELAEDDPSVDGMGTTITAALFDGAQIGVAHLGDSRGFLLRDHELLRITRDHTWVQSLIDEGRITEEEAKVHSYRSLLLKVLDGRHDNEPDLTTYDVQAGDRILICSDGLTGVVSDAEIEQALQTGTPQQAAAELTALALEAGSTDNVTVLIGDVVSDAPTSDEPLVVGAAGDHHRSTFNRLRTWAQRDEPTPHEILMVDPSIDPEELRYAPRAPRRFLWARRLVMVVLVLAIVGGGLALAYNWSQQQYFVGASNGNVVIYRGVNASMPGIDLNSVYEDQHLPLVHLPAFRRSQVQDGISADNLGKAERIVAELRSLVKTCAGVHSAEAATVTPIPPRTTSTPRGSVKTTTTPSTTAGTTSSSTQSPSQPSQTSPQTQSSTSSPAPTTANVLPPPSLSPPAEETRTDCAGAHRKHHR